jgi:hypothetical protein
MWDLGIGLSEAQWLVIVICGGGLMYTIGRHIGIGDALDYMRDKGYIDYDD